MSGVGTPTNASALGSFVGVMNSAYVISLGRKKSFPGWVLEWTVVTHTPHKLDFPPLSHIFFILRFAMR